MKKALIFLFSIATISFATAQSVNIETSTVNWVGTKITGSHEGTINLSAADLQLNDGQLVGGSFTIDMTSLAVTDLQGGGAKKLAGHLMSDDFFGVEAHPSATLVITDVTKAGLRDELTVTGDLTIKGETHPVSFPASISAEKAEAKIKIDRTKYGIKYGSGSFFDDLGDKAIDNMFELNVSLDLTQA